MIWKGARIVPDYSEEKHAAVNGEGGLLRILVLFSVLCLAMVSFRVFYTMRGGYAFLVWNLFLAWIPLFLTLFIRRLYLNQKKGGPVFFVLTAGWLLFYPNAPYILTDFIHLRHIRGAITVWYDLLMVLSFSVLGLFLAFISFYHLYSMIRKWYGRLAGNLFFGATTVLCSIGMFLGRFLRWNSWDMLTRPIDVLSDTIYAGVFSLREFIGFVFLTSLLLGFLYWFLLALMRDRG